MDFKPITITEFQCLVIEMLQSTFPVIKTAGTNTRLSGRIATPALFLELLEFSYPNDRPSCDINLDCTFGLNLVGTSLREKPLLALEELAISLSHFIRGNRWGIYSEPAELISSNADDFSPHDESYRVWTIRFRQLIAIKAHEKLMQAMSTDAT